MANVSPDSVCYEFFQNYLKTHSHLPRVSICTPTFNRRPFIPAIIQCVKNQTYPLERIEWIVVDDGTDPVAELFQDIPYVKYYTFPEKMTLGKKRNVVHSFATGDIFVYMDDDDWYPPDRVAHSVQSLVQSPLLCAGSSEIYVYDTSEAQMYQLGPYGPNHATAGTFAFKRDLLLTTQYSEFDSIAEESAFLKNHTIPMVQLNPIHTIVVFTHNHNSFDKRLLLKTEGQVVHIPDQTGQIYDKVFVQKSAKSLDLFFPRPQDKSLLPFYLTLDTHLKDYDAGLVKHKPDVVKHTNEIFMNRTLNTPIVDITINGETKRVSIQNLVEIIQHLNHQLKNKQGPGPSPGSASDSSRTMEIHIPGIAQPTLLTEDQVNKLVSIQHAEIVKLTERLRRGTRMDPAFFYLLDVDIPKDSN
jgi:glycosyltransferase involved in cell wall biosynthesis